MAAVDVANDPVKDVMTNKWRLDQTHHNQL
jgi:hypothetical protein